MMLRNHLIACGALIPGPGVYLKPFPPYVASWPCLELDDKAKYLAPKHIAEGPDEGPPRFHRGSR